MEKQCDCSDGVTEEVERSSADRRIGGLIPDPCSQCVELSLSKILNLFQAV